jgi:hypothetical protein
MQFRNAAHLCAALPILLCLFFSSAHAQNAPKLEIGLAPLGAAASEKPIPVAAEVTVDVTIKNAGNETLRSVSLIANLNAMKLAQGSKWKADGDNAVLEIEAIKPNETVSQPLALRIEMAPLPPGKQVEIRVEAKSGETQASTIARFAVADCAAAFQADLTRIRIDQISEIWPVADDLRKQDTSLPRGRFFRVVPRRGDLGNIDRIAAGYQARLLADYSFTDQGVRYTVRRWSDELKAFAGQEPNPGICAVNEQMIQGIRKTINYAAVRLDPPQKAFARTMEQIRKALNAGDRDDLRSIALRVAEEAGVKLQEPANSTLKLIEQLRDALKDKKLTDTQFDNLSLIESAAWIEAQAMRSKRLSDLIDGTITGIADAQKKNCVCAF